jgi:hypothetical protein
MVGGPTGVDDQLLQPSVGYDVVFGLLHGYVEAYGNGVSEGDREIRNRCRRYRAAPLLEADVTPRMAGRLAPSSPTSCPSVSCRRARIALRVGLASAGQTVKVATRPSEVAAPAVLMTSASSSTLSHRSMCSCPFLKACSRVRSMSVRCRERKPCRRSVRACRKGVAGVRQGVQAFTARSTLRQSPLQERHRPRCRQLRDHRVSRCGIRGCRQRPAPGAGACKPSLVDAV